MGQCPGCGEWNTLAEERAAGGVTRVAAPRAAARPTLLRDVSEERTVRLATGVAELDRVLGGGLVPGSLVRVETDATHPLAMGLLRTTAGFFSFSSAYEATSGAPLTTAARYGTGDILISGWVDGGDAIAGRSAVAEVSLGTGRVVLLGFRVQHRAQSLATFRFLFNAIFTS